MKSLNKKSSARQRRHWRIRKRVVGTAERPRLSVRRSLGHLYVQLIDDNEGKTILSASTNAKSFSDLHAGFAGNVAAASILGKSLAESAKEKNINQVVFDRSGYKYHGRLKALAEAAREAGLTF